MAAQSRKLRTIIEEQASYTRDFVGVIVELCGGVARNNNHWKIVWNNGEEAAKPFFFAITRIDFYVFLTNTLTPLSFQDIDSSSRLSLIPIENSLKTVSYQERGGGLSSAETKKFPVALVSRMESTWKEKKMSLPVGDWLSLWYNAMKSLSFQLDWGLV